ncbi:hypothetical protein OLMES_5467 [Oleiphilus messinensis]|uniref:Uncharacterized protein n=1 Tax=Oleiphilus messinensis TaxID=141451 RepID=A0A1Y0IG07_9GAMM|nr:hypothetical protein [Oleiphilus messinensis]ARU59447.1 hypothetical protein OLMES_5467 [Oleiphilus messinensis]
MDISRFNHFFSTPVSAEETETVPLELAETVSESLGGAQIGSRYPETPDAVQSGQYDSNSRLQETATDEHFLRRIIDHQTTAARPVYLDHSDLDALLTQQDLDALVNYVLSGAPPNEV